MGNFRQEKMKSRVSHIISELIITNEIKDHRVNSMLSISDVELSRDGAYAKVWVSGYLESLEEAVAGLNSAAGFIQKILGKRLGTKHTPKLNFMQDEEFVQGFKIAKRLKELDSEGSGTASH